MGKNILLARPHPFIVAEMKPFLESGGYSVIKLDNNSNLAAQAKSSNGAVISLAVTSSVDDSAEEVFLQMRQGAPRVPVLFAAMSSLEKLKGSLERLAKNAGIQVNILGVSAENENAAVLGKSETFLYISKDDLLDLHLKAIALRMVQRHFR